MATTGREEDSKWVTLTSCDGFDFVVLRELACQSGTIRRMLDTSRGSWKEGVENRVYFGELSGIVLEKVVEYFYFAEVNKDRQGVVDMDIPPELCLELLVAADYLDT